MNDASMSLAALERSLSALAQDIEYPATPDLTPVVRRRLLELGRPAQRRGFWEPLRRPLAAVVAVLVVLSAFMIASEPARRAVADWLGVDDVRITFDPPPEPVAGDLGLGERVPLETAADAVPFEILVPEALGDPDETYLDEGVSSGMVSLVYAAGAELPEAGGTGAGLLVSQWEADLDGSEIFTKFVRFDEVFSEVEVRGLTGYWIGAAHELFFLDDSGAEESQQSRLAGPALVWEENGIVFRIESELSRSGAIDLAESLEIRD